MILNNNIIDLLRKGKTMSVISGILGNSQNLKIDFPLTNFTKSYAQLIKE